MWLRVTITNIAFHNISRLGWDAKDIWRQSDIYSATQKLGRKIMSNTAIIELFIGCLKFSRKRNSHPIKYLLLRARVRLKICNSKHRTTRGSQSSFNLKQTMTISKWTSTLKSILTELFNLRRPLNAGLLNCSNGLMSWEWGKRRGW